MITPYDFGLLASAAEVTSELSGLLDVPSRRDELICERLRLSCDTTIPANCCGYVADACNDRATRAKRVDSLKMLARHVQFAVPLYKSGPNGYETVGQHIVGTAIPAGCWIDLE